MVSAVAVLVATKMDFHDWNCLGDYAVPIHVPNFACMQPKVSTHYVRGLQTWQHVAWFAVLHVICLAISCY